MGGEEGEENDGILKVVEDRKRRVNWYDIWHDIRKEDREENVWSEAVTLSAGHPSVF